MEAGVREAVRVQGAFCERHGKEIIGVVLWCAA